MSDLLESVKTSNLQTAFKKYLPAVLDEKNVSTCLLYTSDAADE